MQRRAYDSDLLLGGTGDGGRLSFEGLGLSRISSRVLVAGVA